MSPDEVMAKIAAFCTPDFPADSISSTLWKKACCHLLKRVYELEDEHG